LKKGTKKSWIRFLRNMNKMDFVKEYENSMEPKYKLMPKQLGAPLTIQTANQIEDMGKRLNEGIQNIEVSAISPEIAESIPKEHIEEMRRLAQLTETKVSMHAPIVDPSGFTQQGWNEAHRKEAESIFGHVVEKAHALDKSGNVPVVIHGANIVGAFWDKELEEKYKKELEKEYGKKVKEMPRIMLAVDQEKGQIVPLEFEVKEKIAGEKEIWTPERKLRSLNETQWDQEKIKILASLKEIADLREKQQEITAKADAIKTVLEEAKKTGVEKEFIEKHPEKIEEIQNLEWRKNQIAIHINELNERLNSELEDLYNKAVKFAPKETIQRFLKHPELKETRKALKQIDRDFEKINKEFLKLTKKERLTEKDEKKHEELRERQLQLLNRKVSLASNLISVMPTPELFKPVNEFAIEKASDTFANIAFKAFKKFGEKAPIIAIENSYPEMPLARAEELKKAIKKAREKFVRKLVKEKKFSEDKAKRIAEKLIGATWDVGHINLLRKFGFKEEEITEETKKILDFIKHVHLTDNFGLHDVHLPPGMGNVPIKKIIETLKQKKDFDKIRHIIEAGGFVQHFKTSPYPYALETLYPEWTRMSEAALAPAMGYFAGYGEFLPETHFKLYGAGFSGLPSSLGGEAGAPEKGRLASGYER